VADSAGPGNIIQHQSTTGYGREWTNGKRRVLPGRDYAEPHLQQHDLQRVQSVLPRVAEPRRYAAPAQERRHERHEAATQARLHQRRRGILRRRSSMRRPRSRKSKTPTGICWPRGATSRFRKRRCERRSRSSRATSVSYAGVPLRRSTPSSRRRKSPTSKPRCSGRCKRFRVCRISSRVSSLRTPAIKSGTQTSCRRHPSSSFPAQAIFLPSSPKQKRSGRKFGRRWTGGSRPASTGCLCKESIAAASRRAGAVSEQRLRRHPYAGSALIAGYCTGQRQWRSRAAKHVPRRRRTPRVRCHGPITICGPVTSRRSTSRLIVGYPIQGHLARGLRGPCERGDDPSASSDAGRRRTDRRRSAQRAAELSVRAFETERRSRSRASRPRSSTRSELRKFHNGASTTFLVLQRQVELAQARGSELRAQTQLNESVVELQRVEGTILSSNGVNVRRWEARPRALGIVTP
jgi:hypothetical protein